RLLDADGPADFLPPDYVVFVREQTLFAQHLDLKKFESLGEPVLVAEHVPALATSGIPVSTSASGLLAYRSLNPAQHQLIWFDRSGKEVGTLGQPDSAEPINSPQLSPDGQYVALSRMVGGNADLWLIETARGVPHRFTSDPALEGNPVWSPDGSHIVFSSDRKGLVDLYQKSTSGGPEEPLLESSESKNASDWSRDGRFI